MCAKSRSRASASCAIRSLMKKSVEFGRGPTDGGGSRRPWPDWLIAFCIAFALVPPALAEEPVRFGVGFGLAFLPVYICEDLKLVEKYGKGAHLELRPSYQRFLSAGP